MNERDDRTAVVPAKSVGQVHHGFLILSATDRALVGKRIDLVQSPFRVGRTAGNDLVLDCDSISRHHARWERRGDVWWIVDDRSTSGTYVNDEQIREERALQSGDRVKMGFSTFVYVRDDGEAGNERDSSPG